MVIEAFIDCHPPTATAQHKSVRARDAGFRLNRRGRLVAKHTLAFFEKGTVAAARAQLTALFGKSSPARAMPPPIRLTIVWTFYWNKGELAKRLKGKLPAWVPMTVSPDGDNLAKMAKDVLTRLGYWRNDAHASDERFIRGKGDRPGIHLIVEPYAEKDWYVPPEGDVPPLRFERETEADA
jgi:Holliday junction resolvase RusA-like endonuclease